MRADSLPEVTFQRAEFPEIKATPEISATGARFTLCRSNNRLRG